MTRRLLLATRSDGKLRELEPMLVAAGYAPETLDMAGIPVRPDEDARAGRWRGNGKSECGLHAARPPDRVFAVHQQRP